MTDELFARINNESMIHIIEHDDPGEPGYIWQWRGKESEEVFDSQDLALIGAINYVSESYSKLWIAQRQDKKDREEHPFLYPLVNTKTYVLMTFSFLSALIAQLGNSLLDYFLLSHK